MKLIYCISNAFNNIFYKKTYALRLIAGVAFISAIIQISFLIRTVIQNYYDSIVFKNITKNSVVMSTNVSEKIVINQNDKDMFTILKETENTDSPVCTVSLDTMGCINDTNHKFVKLSRTSIVCDDITYTGKEKSMYKPGKFYSTVLSFKADLQLSEYESIDTNTKKQFEYYYPDEELFLYGSPAQHEGEVMINSYIISHYGIKNPDSIVGKTITFYIDNNVYINNLKVSGIINEKYFNMETTSGKSGIIIYDSIANLKEYCIGGEKVTFYVPIKDLLKNMNVYDIIQQYKTNYRIICNKEVLLGLSYTKKLSEISKKILTVICDFLIIAMVLSIFSIVKTNITSSQKYYGMLSAIGMNRRSLFATYFCEHLFCTIISLIASFPFYEILTLVINKIISVMINDELSVTVVQLIRVYCISSVLCVVFISCISCIAFIYSVPKNIIESLR